MTGGAFFILKGVNQMTFNHLEIEPKWQKYWKEHHTFKTTEDPSKKNFYALDMFPYPSGQGLHVGHPEGYTATDAISRMKRAQGYNVLHPMGWDAFGLPAEQYALDTGNDPAEFTKVNVANFKRQINELGFSYDWDREINTTDPEYYKWTQWIFTKLVEMGLAYEAEIPVNWCPALGTVLANEEVIDGKSERGGHPVYRKPMKQWMLKITAYADRLLEDLDELDWPESIKDMQRNWIGRSEGAQVRFNVKGTDESFEVFTTRPDTLFGATYNVLAPEHELVQKIVTPEQKEAVDAYIAAVSTKSDLERTELSKEKTGVFTGAYAINPVNGKEIPIWIADYVLSTYGTGAIMAVPAHDERDYGAAKVSYRLRDWLFSRQRYWGEPIPVIHWEDGTMTTVPESELPLVLPKTDKIRPSGTGESPLAAIEDWLYVTDPVTGKKGRRETNTMPQWAGSSWYFVRYVDPHNKERLADPEKVKQWLPVDLYIGGAEHAVLHLLYARFWYKVLYDLGVVPNKEPFQKLFNQGMILGEGNEKMSKSKGNVVNPDDVVREYGADTLRVYEMFMGPLDASIAWSEKGLEGSRKFLDRFWRLMIDDNGKMRDRITKLNDGKLDKVYHQTVKKVTEDFEELHFNTAISQMMIFVNEAYKADALPFDYMKGLVQLIAPLAPHMAEEIWSKFGFTESISYEPWPTYDESKLVEDEVEIIFQVNGKIKARVMVPTNADAAALESLAKEHDSVKSAIEGKTIRKVIAVPGRLVNIVAN